MIDFQPGQRVESTVESAALPAGRFGTVAKRQTSGLVYVRWDGNIMATGYRLTGRVAQGLRVHQTATTTAVAQAVSRAIDEYQELAREGLYLDDGPEFEATTLRVTEVGAELKNAANGLMSQFTIKTSDGQEWNVRITPKA